MDRELDSAVGFLSNLLKGQNVSQEKIGLFSKTLKELLQNHYESHWFPEKPMKGSGYRCIRINGKMDPLIQRAGATCGLNGDRLRNKFPSELTLWIDPSDVSYRIGEDGSIGVIYNGQDNTQEEYSAPVQQQQQYTQLENSSQNNSNFVQQMQMELFLTACKDQFNRNGYTGSPTNFNLDNLQQFRNLTTFVSS